MTNNPFADIFKAWEGIQLPSADYKEALAVWRKSIEASNAASQALTEGAQAVARRQIEIAQKNTETAMELFKEVYSSKSPETSAAKQADFAKQAFEKAVADSRDLFEIASESGAKAADILGKQVTDNIGQFADKAAPKKKAANS